MNLQRVCVHGVFFFFLLLLRLLLHPTQFSFTYCSSFSFVLLCLSAYLSEYRTGHRAEIWNARYMFRFSRLKKKWLNRREEKDRHNGQQQRKRRRRRRRRKRKITAVYKLQAQLKRKHNETNQAKLDFFFLSLPPFLSFCFFGSFSCWPLLFIFFLPSCIQQSSLICDSIETIKAVLWRSGDAMRKRSLLFKTQNKKKTGISRKHSFHTQLLLLCILLPRRHVKSDTCNALANQRAWALVRSDWSERETNRSMMETVRGKGLTRACLLLLFSQLTRKSNHDGRAHRR